MDKIRPVNDPTVVKMFDHTTVQDMKRHKYVAEEYKVINGTMSIMYHTSGENIAVERIEPGEVIRFDPMVCIWVMPSHNFLATAIKSNESTYENGDKEGGDSCSSYESCTMGKLCYDLKNARRVNISNKDHENS